MKKVILSLLVVIVVLGLFAAAGYAGYRFGYVQGLQANGNTTRPQLRPFGDFDSHRMPMHRFGFGRGGFPIGWGFFGPLMFLGRILVLFVIVGFIYWLFTRSGWRLTREPAAAHPPAEPPQATETSSTKTEDE